MLAGFGKRSAAGGGRAAASWALGDDGPLYCLARRGGVGAGAASLDAFVACPAASSGAHVAWQASAGERRRRGLLSMLVAYMTLAADLRTTLR